MTEFDPRQVAETYRETNRRRGWLMWMIPLWIVCGGFVLWDDFGLPFWGGMLLTAPFVVAVLAAIAAHLDSPPYLANKRRRPNL